jgi:hypothetical protein
MFRPKCHSLHGNNPLNRGTLTRANNYYVELWLTAEKVNSKWQNFKSRNQKFHMQMKLLGITSVEFDIMSQQLLRSSISIRYWRKSGSIMVQYINYLQISRKPLVQLGAKYCQYSH